MSIGQSFQGGFNSGIAYMRQLDDHAQRGLDEDYRRRTTAVGIMPQVSQRVAAPSSAGISVPAGRAPSGGGGRSAQVDGASYVDPSELPLGMRMNERNRLAADDSADKWVKQRQEDQRLGIMTRDQGIRERVQDVNEAESKSKIGIAEATEGRTADVHKLGMDNEKRLLDHQSMMQAFVQKNPQAITTWFVKNAPKDGEGYQQIPTFDMDAQGNWLVEWPGAKQAVPMTEDQLGEVLQSLSPKYERANSDRERTENKLLKEGKIAPKGYGSGGIDVKGMEELRQKQAKYISESSVDDLGVPQTTYEQAYEDLGRGGIFSPQQEPTGYGNRADGTPKGNGYFGAMQRPDGKVSTELSIGVTIDGRETEIPALVPTLSQDEVSYLLNGGKVTDAIVQKAVDHAKQRIASGKSPFAGEGEQAQGIRGPGQARRPSSAAPQKAIEMLKARPELKDAFKAKYGYLPEGF